MIRIYESEKEKVLNMLREEGLENLLLEAWLEDFPLDKIAQLYQLEDGHYVLNVPSIATLFSYPDSCSLTDDERLKIMAYAAPLVMGPHEIVHEIHKLFPDRTLRDTNLMGMILLEKKTEATDTIRLSTKKNFKDLLDLYLNVPEFHSSFEEYTPEGFAEEYKETSRTGSFMATGIYKDGKLVTAATFSTYQIENVCTRPEYRKNGYSTSCLSELLSLIPNTKEGKRIILFTDNPEAMSIYKRLGFDFLGRFSKLD